VVHWFGVCKRSCSGQWNLLGRFHFTDDNSLEEFIEVSAENGTTVADAIRFVKASPTQKLYFVHVDHLATSNTLTDSKGEVI
jgi:hypothetical protein